MQKPVSHTLDHISDLQGFFTSELEEHRQVVEKVQSTLFAKFEQLLFLCKNCIQSGGKILFFGNGGSASDAQHLATELTVRYKENRKAIPALALTTDTSALTAIGNDIGFHALFARQIEAVGKPGDVAIGISTSGQSPNVTRALEQAKKMGIHAAALSGRDGGELQGLADPLLIVPSQTTSRIQEMHIMLGQMLCGSLEIELGMVSQ